MPEYTENHFQNEEHEPPTDEELIAIIRKSKLSKGVRQEMEAAYSTDPWIKRQLQRIYSEIDRVYNLAEKDETTLNMLWEALKDDWKRRKKLPKEERKE
ncbi:MAG: hypothetical protein NTX98_00950 [Candidatus Doudnabacteria bacterium]|nr:hypothetical protein [Candidatus Doudnabacteria bacterium]